MEGKIDIDGFLEFWRKNTFKALSCPFSNDINQSDINDNKYVPMGTSCGDWCPQFGEPEEELKTLNGLEDYIHIIKTGKITLTICQNRTLIFDEFEDERE